MGLWADGDGAFGWRRAKAGLPPERSRASGCPVPKSMREPGTRGAGPRARRRATAQDPDAPARPGLAAGRSGPPVPATAPCGGTARLRAGGGRPCPAGAIGLATGTAVGRAFPPSTAADVCVPALGTAKGRGCVAGGAIFHSEASAPALSLRDGHGKTTCASRSAGPAAAATTPSPRASGRASRTRCTAGGRPRRATRRGSLASSGSRGSTTADARTRRLGTGTRRT